MKPTAYKIGEGERKGLSKDMQEVILAYEEENKKLKEKLSEITMVSDDEKQSIEHILELEEENRKLKESLDIATKCSSKEEDGIIRLSEENKELKSELSKFSEAYKRYRDYEKEELAESCYDFARENDKLKEENRNLKERIKELEKEIEELNKMMLFETKI